MIPRQPGLCAICRRRDGGAGYIMNQRGAKIVWACDGHLKLAAKVGRMSSYQMDKAEKMALAQAGDRAGEYLDHLECTDLRTLNREEWLHFLSLVVVGFGEGLSEVIGADKWQAV